MEEKTVDDYVEIDNRIKATNKSIYQIVTGTYKLPSALDTSVDKMDREYKLPKLSVEDNMDNIFKYAHEVVDLHRTIDEVFTKVDDKGLYSVEDFLTNEDVKTQYDLSGVEFLDAETRNERFTQACQYLNDRIHDNKQRYNPREDKKFNSYLDLAAAKIVLEESDTALELEYRSSDDSKGPSPEQLKVALLQQNVSY
jgi:hypothetical protein